MHALQLGMQVHIETWHARPRAQWLQRSYVAQQKLRSQAEAERVDLQRALATAAAERDEARGAAAAATAALAAGGARQQAGLSERRAELAELQARSQQPCCMSLACSHVMGCLTPCGLAERHAGLARPQARSAASGLEPRMS